MTAGRLKIWNDLAGEWEYVNSPPGPVSEITSDDNTVTITNPSGPTVDLSAGGGSQPVKVIRVPIAYNDAGIVVPAAGKEIYVPEAGEVLLAFAISITTVWDGTNPSGWLYSTGDTYTSAYFAQDDMSVADSSPPGGGAVSSTHTSDNADIWFPTGSIVMFDDAAPVLLVIDDSSGGDPGSMQGEGEVIFVVIANTA